MGLRFKVCHKLGMTVQDEGFPGLGSFEGSWADGSREGSGTAVLGWKNPRP